MWYLSKEKDPEMSSKAINQKLPVFSKRYTAMKSCVDQDQNAAPDQGYSDNMTNKGT